MAPLAHLTHRHLPLFLPNTKVFRPASEGHPSGTGPSKYASGIPKLAARKPKGHQMHDAGGIVGAGMPGQRRSGRASIRGEMSARVVGDLEGAEAAAGTGIGYESGSDDEGGAPSLGLGAMMSRREGGVGSVAVELLGNLGYEVTALTGKDAECIECTQDELEMKLAPCLPCEQHLHGLWVVLGLDD